MSERWLPIPGYPDYAISDLGRIYSARCRGRIMRPSAGGAGYKMLSLKTPDGRSHGEYVHRLVLLAFVGPLPEGMQTRHLDGDKHNNALANLRYGTAKENAADRSLHRATARGAA